MKLIIISSGGGKTTLANKYKNLFYDIDTLIWSEKNSQYHDQLNKAISILNLVKIKDIYKKIVLENKQEILSSNKIILTHHILCANWLELTPIIQLKPVKELHREVIKDYKKSKKFLSKLGWKKLKDAKQFSTFVELENIITELIKK